MFEVMQQEDVPLEQQFGQYISTSFDYDNDILSIPSHAIDDIEEEKKSDNVVAFPISARSSAIDDMEGEKKTETLYRSVSMPDISVLGHVKPILKPSSFTRKGLGNDSRRLPSSSLNSITEDKTVTVFSDTASPSNSSLPSQADSKSCSMRRVTSSPVISNLSPQSTPSTPLNTNRNTLSRVSSMPEIYDMKTVSFQSVEIREYETTLVDNPACRNGPPIGLSWNYHQADAIEFFDYESSRIFTRRSPRQLIIPKTYRQNVLKGKGHSEEEFKRIKKEVKKVRSSRNMTNMFGSMFEVKEALEDAGRSIKKKMKKNGLNYGGHLSSSSHI